MKLSNFKINSKNKNVAMTSSRQCAGINITDRSINMVLLNARNLNQIRLENYVVAPLPDNIISNGNIENYDEFVARIQQAWKLLRTNCKNITVAIPQKSVNLQFLTMDQESGYTPEERVLIELDQTNDDGGLSYDYQVIPGKQQTELLLASTKREEVDRIMDLFYEADIEPTQMDVDLLAAINSYIVWINERQPELTNQNIAIFDVSLSETRAIFMRNDSLLYKQEINLGYEQMIQLIRRNYQLTEQEAWDMFYTPHKPDDYDQSISLPFQQQFIQEIQRTLQFYFTASNMDTDSNINQIMIFGYGSQDAHGFANRVKEQTRITTQQINPVLLAEPDTKIDQAQFMQDSNLLTVPFGLAVRGL